MCVCVCPSQNSEDRPRGLCGARSKYDLHNIICQISNDEYVVYQITYDKYQRSDIKYKMIDRRHNISNRR